MVFTEGNQSCFERYSLFRLVSLWLFGVGSLESLRMESLDLPEGTHKKWKKNCLQTGQQQPRRRLLFKLPGELSNFNLFVAALLQ